MGGQLHFNERYPESEDGSRKSEAEENRDANRRRARQSQIPLCGK